MTKANLKNIFYFFATFMIVAIFFFTSCSKEYNMNQSIDDNTRSSATRTIDTTSNVMKLTALLYQDSLMFKTVLNKIAMIQLVEQNMIIADSTKTANFIANYSNLTDEQGYNYLQQNFDPTFLRVFKAASIGQVKSYQKILNKYQSYMDQEIISNVEFRDAYAMAFTKIFTQITNN